MNKARHHNAFNENLKRLLTQLKGTERAITTRPRHFSASTEAGGIDGGCLETGADDVIDVTRFRRDAATLPDFMEGRLRATVLAE